MNATHHRGHRWLLFLSVPPLLILFLALGSHAYLLLALCWIALLLIGWRQARGSVAELDARRETAPGAFEQDWVSVRLEIVNHGRRDISLLGIKDHFGPSLQEQRTVALTGAVPGRFLRRLSYEGMCTRLWGVYPVGPLELTGADTLGLFYGTKQIEAVSLLSVYPHVYRVDGLSRLGARSSLTRQDHSVGRRGQSELYMGVREYQTGDDPRRLHWPATARFGTPMVREQELDLQRYFSLFLDLHRGHRAGFGRKSTFEFIVRVGASLISTAARDGQFVQVFSNRPPHLLLPPGRGEAHLQLALGELVRLAQDGEDDLTAVVEDNLPSLPAGSTAVLLLATATPDLARVGAVLEQLRARAVRPSFVLVNRHSFLALDKRPPQREELVEHRRRLSALLHQFDAQVAFLEGDEVIEHRLRLGLFAP